MSTTMGSTPGLAPHPLIEAARRYRERSESFRDLPKAVQDEEIHRESRWRCVCRSEMALRLAAVERSLSTLLDGITDFVKEYPDTDAVDTACEETIHAAGLTPTNSSGRPLTTAEHDEIAATCAADRQPA